MPTKTISFSDEQLSVLIDVAKKLGFSSVNEAIRVWSYSKAIEISIIRKLDSDNS